MKLLLGIIGFIAFCVAVKAMADAGSEQSNINAFTGPKARDIEDFELEPYRQKIGRFKTIAVIAIAVIVITGIILFRSS